MSLIDEALKRAEVEAARRDGLRRGTYPWVMEQQPKKRRRWMPIAVIAVTLAIATGGLLWILRRSAPIPDSRFQVPVGSTESKIQNPKSKSEKEAVEVAPPPKSQSLRAAPAAGKSDPQARKADVSPPHPSSAAAAEASRPRSATAPPAPPAAPAEQRPTGPAAKPNPPARGIADGKTYAGEVPLPEGGKIVLEGIVYSETNPVALINGKILPPGGVVEEFTIVSIHEDRVELRKLGLTIFLVLK